MMKTRVPNGGWGWMIVLGIAIINMVNQSLISLFGLIFGDELESMGHGTFGVALVMNINSMVTNFSGIIIGPILKKFSPKTVTLVGVLLSSFGMILASFSTNLMQIIAAYSILTGLGLGLIMPGTFMAVNSYFDTKRQQAVGLSMTGTSVGQMLMPHVVSFLLNEYGYRGTTLILGGLCLNGIAGSLLFHPVKWHLKIDTNPTEKNSLLAKHSIKTDFSEKDDGIWNKIVSTLDLDLMKDPIFIHLSIGVGLIYSCSVGFSMLYPFFLHEALGYDRKHTALCMSVLSGADIIGRITIPIFTNSLHLGNRTTLLLGAGIIALCRSFLAFQSDFAMVLFGAFLCGYVRAATVINQNLAISEYVDGKKLAPAIGLNMVAKGVFVLTVGQFFGWVRDETNSFPITIHVQNMVIMFVVFSWSIELICKRLRTS